MQIIQAKKLKTNILNELSMLTGPSRKYVSYLLRMHGKKVRLKKNVVLKGGMTKLFSFINFVNPEKLSVTNSNTFLIPPVLQLVQKIPLLRSLSPVHLTINYLLPIIVSLRLMYLETILGKKAKDRVLGMLRHFPKFCAHGSQTL